MKGYIAIAVAVILMAASLPYGSQILRRQVFPTLSTWIILVVATSLNVVSYLVATRLVVLSGVLGLTDAFVCWFIFIATTISTGLKLQFQTFEKYYLIASGVIVLFWMLSRSAFIRGWCLLQQPYHCIQPQWRAIYWPSFIRYEASLLCV
jgi:hypothetical protein